MNPCLLTLALALSCPAPAGPPLGLNADTPAADAWIAEDKLRHFALSFAATQMAYGGARSLVDPDLAVPVAAGAAITLGLVKEITDARRGGSFSLRDLAWDVAGTALGILLVRNIR